MSDPVTTNGQTVPVTVPQDSIWDHPGAVAGVAIATALALSGTLYLAGAFADTGDEPPIRVKNGSIELYLASSGEKWKQKNAKHWKISGGKRSKDPLDVSISTTASCSGAIEATGSLVTVVYEKADRSTVTISIGTDPDQPNQKHSAVLSTEPLALASSDPKERLLTYADEGGFIRSVSMDNKELCAFTKAAPLVNLVIAHW